MQICKKYFLKILNKFYLFQKLATSAASDGEYSPLYKDPVNYPEYVVENVGLSRQSSEVTKCDDAIPVQSQPLDNHHENKAPESVVIVEDLTNSTPPGIPSSKVAYHVSNIEDEDSDECSSPRETDTGSTAPESDDKVNILPIKFKLRFLW